MSFRIVVARALTNRITQEAYEDIFRRMFEGVQSRHSAFKAGVSLRGIVVDWSDTQRSALGAVLGEEVAASLCKGCKVTDIVQQLYVCTACILHFFPFVHVRFTTCAQ